MCLTDFFDLNGDGELDTMELAIAMCELDSIISESLESECGPDDDDDDSFYDF